MQERFETFTVLINRISRNIRKIKNQEMAEYGLRSAHTGVRLSLSYTMKDKANNVIVATAASVHCFINNEGHPAALSKYLPELDSFLKRQ